MGMTPEGQNITLLDREKAEEWLTSQWSGLKECPICQQNIWNMPNELVSVNEYRGAGVMALGSTASFPFVMVVCSFCGYTMFFNAVVMGLVKG